MLAAIVAVGAQACRYDPVPQDIIDSLGEETGTPGPAHRPGQPCLACHSTYEGATPSMAVAGTLYMQDPMTDAVMPAPFALVIISDSSGDARMACSNAAGNFYITDEEWSDIAFPLAVASGDRTMRSLIGRDGSCGSCHKLPAGGFGPDAGTGATFDSPGVVLVSPDTVNDPACPGGGGS
jgi:hypothetical protein